MDVGLDLKAWEFCMLFRIMLCSKGFVGLIPGGLIPVQEMTRFNESVGFQPAARKVQCNECTRSECTHVSHFVQNHKF